MNALVKILSGVQNGAELVLVPGEYRLGSGDDADIVLADAAVRPCHATVMIAEDGWTVRPEGDAGLRLDGETVEGPVSVAPFQVLTLGGTHVAFGPEGPWPSLPDIPPPKSSRGADGSLEGEESSDVAPSVEQQPARCAHRSWKTALAIALALVAAGEVWHHRLQNGGVTRREEAAAALTAALKEHGFDDVREEGDSVRSGSLVIGIPDSGKTTVDGIVANADMKRRLFEALGELKLDVHGGPRTADEEVQRVRRELAGVYPELELSYDGRQAVLDGMVMREEEAGAAYRFVRDRLDDSVGLRRRHFVWPQLRDAIERHASRIGLAAGKPQWKNGRIVFARPDSPNPGQRGELVRLIAHGFGESAAALLAAAAPNFENEDQGGEPEESGGEWRVMAITEDGFIDQERRRHAVGDCLSGNLRLVQAWPRGVVLQRGVETIVAGLDDRIGAESVASGRKQ